MNAMTLRLALAFVVGCLLSTAPKDAQAQAVDPRQMAVALDRLNAMEQELRTLRGQIELLEYDQKQLEDRLAVAERRAAGPSVQGAVEPNPSGQAGPTLAAPTNPQIGQVTGTLPREAVVGAKPPAGPTSLSQQQAALPAAPVGSYAAAREFLNRGDTTNAEAAFRRFLDQHPNDPDAAQAAYILGDLYLARGAWQEAASTFAKNYQGYGADSPRAADNLLKLGIALARGGEKDKACQTFTELQRRYPNAQPAIVQALSRERATAACA